MTDAPSVPAEPPGRGLLEGLGVVVTAAAGTGIGGALARRCLLEGARLVISDAHERRLGETADALADEFGHRPIALHCDVTDDDSVRALVATSEVELGGIDVWMNNAGLGGNGLVTELTDEEWDRVIDVTLGGTFKCLRAVLPGMYERGRGAVVNNASVLGWRAQERQSHYAAAKAGVMAPDPQRSRRGRAPRGPRQRSRPEPRHARQSGEGDTTGSPRGTRGPRGLRAGSRTVGGRQRDGVPGVGPVELPDRRGGLGLLAAPLTGHPTGGAVP